jgi:hypothetical protein
LRSLLTSRLQPKEIDAVAGVATHMIHASLDPLRLLVKRASRLFPSLLLCAAACYPMNWARVEPIRFGRQQQVKIWSHDSVYRWHAVVMTHDSISGIPYQQSTKCDSCRLRLPRASVDSIRAGYPTSRLNEVVGLVLITVGLIGLFYPGS